MSYSDFITKEDIASAWDTHFNESVNAVIDSNIHKAAFSVKGKDMIHCANLLKDSTNFKDAAGKILSENHLENCHGSLSERKETIFTNYHTRIVCNISDLEFGLQHQNANVLHATVLSIIEHFIQVLFRIKLEEISTVVFNCSLSDTDQEVVMYVSGYLLQALKKQCLRFKADGMKELIEGLLNKNQNGKVSFCTKYREWTVKVDRGGLLHPCDDFFLLIRNMEIAVNRHISSQSLSQDLLLKTTLIELCLNNVNVSYLWAKLCTDSDESLSNILLEKVASLFLTVRGFAYARLVKSKLKKEPLKGKIALRQGLKGLQK